ncbi:MAG: hydrogenase small subunit [Veillonella sp.]|nr:hydrogenase small subunit [Veillonella sp.]MCF0155534.1 hydrogenase small subunit [Veillonella sp.]
MKNLWSLFQERRLSRRTFMKSCVALTAVLGLPPTMLDTVVKAAETKELPTVIWLHGHECTGCSEAFIRSSSPFTSDVILNMIALEYDDTLSAASGEALENHLQEVIAGKKGEYILAVEGGVPLDEDGIYCMVGGKTFKHQLKEVAEGAAAIIAYGSCSAWGGIQAAEPNPTNTVAITDVISGKPIIRVPGCPPIPEVMTGVIMSYALFGKIPPLDSQGRPKQFYGNRIHDTCYRRAFFDSGLFVEAFDDDASKAGWCLYKVGCRGPETYNSCGNLRWWNGLSYPIQSGHGCIGCSEKGFWDNDDFYNRLPEVVLPNTITTADTVGTVAAAAAAGAVIVHGAATIARAKYQDIKEEQRLRAEGKWGENGPIVDKKKGGKH